MVAVRILHAHKDAIARLHLACGTALRDAPVDLLFLLLLALEALGQGFLFLIDDFTAGHGKLAVSRDANLDIRQGYRAELFLECLRVVALNHVAAGQLQHPVLR